jgi:iron complex transport system ATP-binding protein
MIYIKNLMFSYENNLVLEDVTYAFKQPKIYTVIGPNGAGKSTLMKCIAGILKKNSGSIRIQDKNIEYYERKELARQLAFIPQNYYTNFDYSVEDIVKMGRFPYSKILTSYSSEDTAMVEKTLKRLDLFELKKKSILNLSGGEMQRTFIARALVQDTPIILLDESFANLDIHHQIDIAKTLHQLQKEENKIIIMITHNLNLASEFSDEILLLKNGKIFDSGSPENVLTKENLNEVYNHNVQVSKNPISQRPLVFFTR